MCCYFGKAALMVLKEVKWIIVHLSLPFNFAIPFSETSLSLGSVITNFRAQKQSFFDQLSELFNADSPDMGVP